jgi:predicted ATP-grasp superfamily ATP-dependent carboligase
VRVFVSEYLVGGAIPPGDASSSMRREGLAMLRAVVADIARLLDFSVVTTLESDLSLPDFGEVIAVENAEHESDLFQRLLSEVDAVLVIAPETDGVLAERCRRVRSAGVVSWNCSPEAIELCGDKWLLAEHLQAHGFPTIPTRRLGLGGSFDELKRAWTTGVGVKKDADPFWGQGGAVVLKPCDGAGSCLTFLVTNEAEWGQAIAAFIDAGELEKCLVQPFVAGRALSVGINISLDGRRIECLPVGEQKISDDGRFRYLGGTIPASISSATSAAIEDLAVRVCRTIPGLVGYIGMDLLLTSEGEPVIVEVNPRLTTAYVGYRQLDAGLLPSRWLTSCDSPVVRTRGSESVDFDVE